MWVLPILPNLPILRRYVVETKQWTCDCGCGAVADTDYHRRDWLVVRQEKGEERTVKTQLLREFHFVDLLCLARWSGEVAPKFKEMAKEEDSHGFSWKGGVRSYDHLDICT